MDRSSEIGESEGDQTDKTQVTAKAIVCFLKTDDKTFVMKTAPTRLTEYGEVKLVPAQRFHPNGLVFI